MFPWQFRTLLWKWVLVCGVAAGLAEFAFEVSYSPNEMEAEELSESLFDLVALVPLITLNAILYTVFCIRCHRLVLLGSKTEADPFPPQFAKREFTFFSYLVFISFGVLAVVLVIGTPISLVGFGLSNLLGFSDTVLEDLLIGLMLGIPAAYLLGRYCMVFPATAIDLEPKLNWAWEQSKDVAWRLGILAGFLPGVRSLIFDENLSVGPDQYAFAYSLAYGLVSFAFTAVEVALLSVAFRELSGVGNLQKA